jgi:glycerophosphoryl diester phosphodiesterase
MTLRCFGHRGAKGHVLENTIASFTKAYDLGAEWVELDIQLVSGVFYVFHDATLERLAGIHKKLADLTPIEIEKIRLEGGHAIPSLQKVLESFAGKLKFNIELKGLSGARELAAFLSTAFSSGWKIEDLIISSFNLAALKELHKLCPEVWIGLLYYGLPSRFALDVRECGARSVHLSLEYVAQDIVNEIHSLGCKMYVYTVNEMQEILKMETLGVDGVFTDFPERIIQSKSST